MAIDGSDGFHAVTLHAGSQAVADKKWEKGKATESEVPLEDRRIKIVETSHGIRGVSVDKEGKPIHHGHFTVDVHGDRFSLPCIHTNPIIAAPGVAPYAARLWQFPIDEKTTQVTRYIAWRAKTKEERERVEGIFHDIALPRLQRVSEEDAWAVEAQGDLIDARSHERLLQADKDVIKVRRLIRDAFMRQANEDERLSPREGARCFRSSGRRAYGKTTKRRVERMFKSTIVGMAAIAIATASPVAAKEIKLSLAAGPQGSVNYVLASGFGTVISRYTDYKVTVVPYQGTTTLLPAIADGRHDAGVNDAGSVYEGYNGVGQFKQPHKSLRLLSSGSVNHIAIAVRANSDIKSPQDLKGKRVTAVFAALPICQTHSNAILDNLGIKWSEVRKVPVTNIIQAAQALADGRVDAMLCAAPAIAKFREINAQTPLRFIGINPDPAAMKRARKHYRYNSKAAILPKKTYGWLPNKAAFLAYPWYLYGNEKMDQKVVQKILQVIWDHKKELAATHPIFRGWTHKAMLTTEPQVPYHPGAVAFYKGKGVWTDEVAAAQKKLLAK